MLTATVDGTCRAQTDLAPGVLVLARAQQKVAARLKAQQDYTCLQTVQRWSRNSAKKPLKPADTVRLDVAYIGGQEYFSWPGARSFEQKSPASFISSGTISGGSFAGDLSVALGRSARATFLKEEHLNGRRTFRYEYEVSPFLHQAEISASGRTGTASVRGSFWVNPESFDVLRLETRAHEISPVVPISELVSVVDYAPVRIGSREVWLPQVAVESTTFASGKQDRNQTHYSHCRAYAGESTIRFDDAVAADTTPAPAAVKKEVQLPAGLKLPISLDTDIDLTKAAVGDLISGTVGEEVAARGPVRITKGAAVRGRIRMLVHGTDATAHTIAGLKFTELELDGSRAVFYAKLEQVAPSAGIRQSLDRTSKRSTSLGGGAVQAFEKEVTQIEQLRLAELPGVGTFFVDPNTRRLPKGLRMLWVTEAVR